MSEIKVKPTFFRSWILFLLLLCCSFVFLLSRCSSTEADVIVYRNHAAEVQYVGMNTCKTCHADIYNTFIETGMGKSFGAANHEKSSAVFDQHAHIYDSYLDLHYQAYFSNDVMYIKEYRLKNGDTVHSRTEKVDYVVGSGQHTNSHIFQVNGYYFQMPMTFYTQQQRWDFPPGFENGFNSRFSRSIELECMSCHNAYPNFVPGSKNKYASVLQGIDCERCHGPGSLHVEEKSKGILVDTANEIDYSIVNPKKLPYDLQVDVCQRCHLQGNAVLAEGKSFFDFKPGQKLSEFMNVFLPRYENEKGFIMASHADRLKQSKCFVESAKRGIDLEQKKYSNAKFTNQTASSLTCISCHNPHVSIKKTGTAVLNNPCKGCHQGDKNLSDCTASLAARKVNNDNCSGCHMPSTGTIDIPHVTVHDHRIQIPVAASKQQAIEKFVGLASVNNPQVDAHTKAEGYISYYEKFENKAIYLDSAAYYLAQEGKSSAAHYYQLQIRLAYLATRYAEIIKLAKQKPTAYSQDAWTNYRIAEAILAVGTAQEALPYISLAVQQAAFNLEFRNKLANVYLDLQKIPEAERELGFILQENPKYSAALSNYGYIQLMKGNTPEAKRYFAQALALDPDYEQALFNAASVSMMENNKKQAIIYIQRILDRSPSNEKAKFALQKIKNDKN